jgi:putative transposase
VPRIPRAFADGFIYHVLNRGNGKRNVFHKNEDFQTFTDFLRLSRRLYPIKVLAYCMMPNHFHMIVWPERAEELSKWMQWLMTTHVRRHHQIYGTNGHVWQGRFRSFVVQQDDHLLNLMRYVENNPVRSGLVDSALEWHWSSHAERLGKKPRDLADSPPLELPEDWDRYVGMPLTGGELERLRQSVNRQSPYGNPLWQFQVCEELGLESTIRPKGRPRNSL